jgi:hypothetical protein
VAPGGDSTTDLFEGAGPGGGATADSKAISRGTGNAVSSAAATGGSGGDTHTFGGVSGVGGDATATSVAATAANGGRALSDANARGGDGGSSTGLDASPGLLGGDATAHSIAQSGIGPAVSSATATGGMGSSQLNVEGSEGGIATALAEASASGGGTAIANSVATGGVGGAGSPSGARGAANATSSAETAKGALAQAQSTAVGSSGQAQSIAKSSLAGVSVQSSAVAPTDGTATTNAIAQGGAGQAFVNPGQTAYAFSTALPDKAYATSLIGGASDVASALLGPRDVVFGTAIMGANYAPDGGGVSITTSASSTFDFVYPGDLQLGLIDDQVSGFAKGLGFQSMEFTIQADGVEVLDVTFGSLAIAESFFRDDVIDLGSDFGPKIDLTFGYTLIADGPGGFGFDLAIGGAVPEPSTWAMMLVGFAGLGFAGYRSTRRGAPALL